MVRLTISRLLVAHLRFGRWSHLLGKLEIGGNARQGRRAPIDAVLAAAVERAATRLPFATKCLPRAMALQAMLHRRHRPGVLVLATLPGAARGGLDDLHAWTECAGQVLIGQSALPYRVLARFGHG